MTSPSTASRSGVEAMIARMSESITCTECSESDHGEDHDRLPEGRNRGGDVRRTLQLARTGGQRAEEKCGEQRRQRVQLREQRDCDTRISIASSEALEEPVGDAEELDAASEPG